MSQIWQQYEKMIKEEFFDYGRVRFQADLLAGITVAAVALPLALAFGVASGATAAAGLVTAIIAGLLIGILGGAGTQISGPTGAMSAILIVLVHQYGLEGVWITSVLAAIILLIMGIFNFGQVVNYIPSSVITGFTSGIALVIAIGQIDNLLGVKTPSTDNAAAKLLGYFQHPIHPNFTAIILALIVVAIMLWWPESWSARVPGSLIALVLVTAVTIFAHLHVPTIGSIPKGIILAHHLSLAAIPWNNLVPFIFPAITIALLGATESLLCGVAGSRMSQMPFYGRMELLAQGIGNLIIPFIGGVPATAAIARVSVGIRSGGKTRLVSIIHALLLLIATFLLGPVLSHIPLAVLAGILFVTAWRMNEWYAIHNIFHWRINSSIATFLLTMIATVLLDLTRAIAFGIVAAAIFVLWQMGRVHVSSASIDTFKLSKRGYTLNRPAEDYVIVYIAGPLFFGNAFRFEHHLSTIERDKEVIFNLSAMTVIDVTGVHVLQRFVEQLENQERSVSFCSVHPPIRRYLEPSGILSAPHQEYDSLFEAIVDHDTASVKIEQHTASPKIATPIGA